MTPAKFIERRRGDWLELQQLLDRLENRADHTLDPDDYLRFGRLYRSACTDLSLSNTWRLPRDVQLYLEDLVSRSHSHLYSFHRDHWLRVKEFFTKLMPRAVFADIYVRICILAFYIPLVFSAYLAYESRAFATAVIGEAEMEMYEDMHAAREDANPGAADMMAGTGFYVWNNVSIALLTFGIGILGGVMSLVMVLFNAVYLGAILGFLLTGPASENILSWIPGHGPFELTAIAIAGGAGLRMGFSFIAPGGRRRLRALREEAEGAVPIIAASVVLLFLAAFLEATVAPSALPVYVKFAVGGASLLAMIAYFGIYGGYLHRRERLEEAVRLQRLRARPRGEHRRLEPGHS